MKYTERLFPDLSQSMGTNRTSTSETTKKKLPFKAPSRVDSTNSASALSKAAKPSAKPTAKKSVPAKTSAASKSKSNGFKPASKAVAVELSSDEDSDELDETPPKKKQKRQTIDISEDEDGDEEEQEEASEHEEPARTAKTKQTAISDDPAIPQKLLTRLLYEGFEDKNMKIGKEAMTVVGKYMETFVREALARAVYEREEAETELGKDTGDGFLQVSCALENATSILV